ncbi:predicted protein [Sclerotinia sclerotiorum 1980 UF-70]|uniref:Uncharacterized protein n=1 Tax=Sclerotinia sclerotiorum (strain ATCC 18683 / 1980 / Ss-1) TaxID=665079 RepID=A7F1W5_SCLS1|nr:predicted protein [Sclerotinia sclerotiorum 1980 UF-70]EDN95707.1 predicted protein [Sclerotinia sclerotiorum 1980 UF-70]
MGAFTGATGHDWALANKIKARLILRVGVGERADNESFGTTWKKGLRSS